MLQQKIQLLYTILYIIRASKKKTCLGYPDQPYFSRLDPNYFFYKFRHLNV